MQTEVLFSDSVNTTHAGLGGMMVVFRDGTQFQEANKVDEEDDDHSEAPQDNETTESTEPQDKEEDLPVVPGRAKDCLFGVRYKGASGPRIVVGSTATKAKFRPACLVRGCTNRAQMGNSDKPRHCLKHGGGKRCAYAGCIKSAAGKTTFCVFHGGGQRCCVVHMHPGCDKAPYAPVNLGNTPKDAKGKTYPQYANRSACRACKKALSKP
tara:strand:- start:126 stop:755 length:630 start_codon:yes stop_codon:yes gene_type:complete